MDAFGATSDTKCLPEGSPKIDQKTASKKSGNVLKKVVVFFPQYFQKSLKIEPRAKIVPRGVQGRSQASKSLLKASKKIEKGIENRHKTHQELIPTPDPTYHSNA